MIHFCPHGLWGEKENKPKYLLWRIRDFKLELCLSKHIWYGQDYSKRLQKGALQNKNFWSNLVLGGTLSRLRVTNKVNVFKVWI